jgi:hypothetical protein
MLLWQSQFLDQGTADPIVDLKDSVRRYIKYILQRLEEKPSQR